LNAVSNASIADFAHQGLDSSNAYCGPFRARCCRRTTRSVKRRRRLAALIRPWDRTSCSSRWTLEVYRHSPGVRRSQRAEPLRRVRRFDVALAYTLSRYRTNIAEPNGSGGIIRG